MVVLKQKKVTKIVAIVVAALFIAGIGAVAVTQSRTSAASTGSGAIGYVDLQKILSSSADYAQAAETLNKEADNLQKEFEQKAAALNDQEKRQLFAQYQQRLSAKRQEVMKQVQDKITAAIKDVATANGISVVLDKNNVLYGGKDLTDDVIKKLK